MASITSPGIGSGLDVNKIVTDLIAAERIPFDSRHDSAQKDITEKISAFGKLKSNLSDLDDVLFKLKLPTTFSKRSVENASTKFDIEAGSAAQPGSYNIEVEKIATAHKITSPTIAGFIGEGTMKIDVGSNTANITVAADDTLQTLKDKINNLSSNPGVTATIITADDGEHLVLTGNETGLANEIKLTITDDDGDLVDGLGLSRLSQDGTNNFFTENTPAEDAKIKIDGSLTITSASNKVEGAIEGVILNLKEAHEVGKSDIFKVSLDTDSVKEELEKFVESFNSTVAQVVELSAVNVDAGTKGILTGDGTLRTMMNQIRNAIAQPVTLSNGLQVSMSSIGITTQRDGTLELDNDRLTKAISTDFDQFKELFSGTDGVGKKLATIVTEYKTTGGILDDRINGLQISSKDWDDEKINFEKRLSSTESRLYAQFLAMDQIVAKLTNTGTFLDNQLSNLPGFTSKK
ncbi:flagellar filament capping protein FliD [Pseudoalteromonas denitrificans]|uniref:Flagellar hook-associated protein 2 n=1 Tax=Pseudoalteromonas denitrificans DSM 6059 TaxID=1123010 RepID=A0A1I1HKR5_9GAMM|nr:flagellar filament capping protein FliD [Pseudoalteromonas denitrificans]SFC24719.1 flagellar hook-associated protein 2 [Pseudoalteromonas denitrificans DSM 6059]